MARLRKSAKILIISLVSIFCVASIVLGCIFGLRKPAEKPAPQVSALEILGEEINSRNKSPELTYFKSAPFSYAEMTNEKSSNVIEVGDNYFVLEDPDNPDSFHFFAYRSAGEGYETKDLTAIFGKQDCLHYEVGDIKNGYAVIKSVYEESFSSYLTEENIAELETSLSVSRSEIEAQKVETSVYSVVYFQNFNAPVEVFQFDAKAEKCFNFDYENSNDNVKVTLNDEYVSFEYQQNVYLKLITENIGEIPNQRLAMSSYDSKVAMCKLKTTAAGESERLNIDLFHFDIEGETKYVSVFAYDKLFLIEKNDSLEFITISNGAFKRQTLQMDLDDVWSISQICKNKFLVEVSKTSSTTASKDSVIMNDGAGTAMDFLYKIIEFDGSNFVMKDFAKSDGVGRITAGYAGSESGDCYFVQEQLVENHILQEKYNFFYYGANNECLLKFFSLNSDERVEYFASGNFLTKYRILKPNGANFATDVVVFATDDEDTEHLKMVSENYASSVLVQKNEMIGVLGLDGNFLLSPENSIFSLSETDVVSDHCIVFDGINYYNLNMKNGAYTEIQNYVNFSSTKVFTKINTLQTNNFNVYAERNADDDFSLYNFNGNKISENFFSIEPNTSLETGIWLNFLNEQNEVIFSMKSDDVSNIFYEDASAESVSEIQSAENYSLQNLNSSSYSDRNQNVQPYDMSITKSDDKNHCTIEIYTKKYEVNNWGTKIKTDLTIKVTSDPGYYLSWFEMRVPIFRSAQTPYTGSPGFDSFLLTYNKQKDMLQKKLDSDYNNALIEPSEPNVEDKYIYLQGYDVNDRRKFSTSQNYTGVDYIKSYKSGQTYIFEIVGYNCGDLDIDAFDYDNSIYSGVIQPYYNSSKYDFYYNSLIEDAFESTQTYVYQLNVIRAEGRKEDSYTNDRYSYPYRYFNDAAWGGKMTANIPANELTSAAYDRYAVLYNRQSVSDMLQGAHPVRLRYDASGPFKGKGDYKYNESVTLSSFANASDEGRAYYYDYTKVDFNNIMAQYSNAGLLSPTISVSNRPFYLFTEYEPNVVNFELRDEKENGNFLDNFYTKYGVGIYKDFGCRTSFGVDSEVIIPSSSVAREFLGYYYENNNKDEKFLDVTAAGDNLGKVTRLHFSSTGAPSRGVLNTYGNGTHQAFDYYTANVLIYAMYDYKPLDFGFNFGSYYNSINRFGATSAHSSILVKDEETGNIKYETIQYNLGVRFSFGGKAVQQPNMQLSSMVGAARSVSGNAIELYYDVCTLKDITNVKDSSGRPIEYNFYKFIQNYTSAPWSSGFPTHDLMNPRLTITSQKAYLFSNWAFYDAAKQRYIEIDQNTTIGVVQTSSGNVIVIGGFSGAGGSAGTFVVLSGICIYAVFKLNPFYIQGKNADAGGSVKDIGELERNSFLNNSFVNYDDSDKAKCSIEWTVNSDYKEEQAFDSVIFASNNAYYKINSQDSVTLKFTIKDSISQYDPYILSRIELQNYAYYNKSGRFVTGVLTVGWDSNDGRWKVYKPDDAGSSYTDRNSVSITSNLNSRGTLEIRVSNCEVGCDDWNGKNPALGGKYGFIVVAYAESNATNSASVNATGNDSEFSVDNNVKQWGMIKIDNNNNSVWLNGFNYKLNVSGNGYLKLSNGEFSIDNDATDFYYDSTHGYFYYNIKKVASGEWYGVNFNNTQVYLIEPAQKEVLLSQAYGSSSTTSSTYELKQYLREVEYAGETIQLGLAQRSVDYLNNNWAYSELKFENESSGTGGTISYLGKNYTVLDSYVGTNFAIFMVRDNSSNKVYYLFFTDIQSNVSSYGKTLNLAFEYVTSKLTYSDIAEDFGIRGMEISGWETDLEDRIYPTDQIKLPFLPSSGYLIKSVTVTLGGQELFKLELSDIDLQKVTGTTGDYYSFLTSQSGSSGTRINHIRYTLTGKSMIVHSGSDNNVNGIAFATSRYSNFVQGAQDGGVGAETIYLMISSLYRDIDIKVETIEYMEFVFNDTTGTVGFEEDASLGALKFGYYEHNNLKILSDADLGESFTTGGVLLKKLNDTDNVYRLIFLGSDAVNKLFDGFRIFAMDGETTYKFTNGQFYGNSKFADNNEEFGNFDYRNIEISVNLASDATYTIRFSPYYPNSDDNKDNYDVRDSVSGDKYHGYITATKYLFAMDMVVNTMSFNLESRLNNHSITEGEDDVIYQLDNGERSSSWFIGYVLSNICVNYNTADSITWADYLNNSSAAVEFSGTGIRFVYYAIPGYWLKFIKLSSNTSETITQTIDISSLAYDVDNYQFTSTWSYGGTEDDDQKVNFTLRFVNDENNVSYFELTLCPETMGESETLGTVYDYLVAFLMLGNINVKFYSEAMALKLNYSNDYYGSYASRPSSLGAREYSLQSKTTYYDLPVKVAPEHNPVMPGYTFVGWTSNSAVYAEDNFTWSSGSSWNWNGISSYLSGKFNSMEEYSDFYVADGYFMTDAWAKDEQNYNFWAVYRGNTFNATLNQDNIKTKIDPSSNIQFSINLYAVWKANTYRLQFDLNDRSQDQTINRGSTNAYISLAGNSFGPSNAIASGLIQVGNLSYVGQTSNNVQYYVYVTFDSSNWFISNSLNPYEESAELIDGNELNVRVDRYGYTWLGWTGTRQARIEKGGDSATDIFIMKAKDPSAVPLNYQLLNEKFETVHEIDTKFIYFGQEKADPTIDPNIKVRFYSYGDLNLNEQNDGTYRTTYDYLNFDYVGLDGVITKITQDKDKNKFYLTYFDTSISLDCYNAQFNDDTNQYNWGIRLYPGEGSTKSYEVRTIDLYAYWSANRYQVSMFLRDSNDNDLRFGSSNVTNRQSLEDYLDKNINYIYFDDVEAQKILNLLIPTRIGYDFLGWAYVYDASTNLAAFNGFNKDNYLSLALLDNYGTGRNYVLKVQSGFNEDYKLNNEQFGDEESEHYIQLYAVWSPQIFTFSISLNIDNDDMSALRELDSNFAASLFGSNRYDIPQNWLKTYTVNNGTLNRDKTFDSVIANVLFEVTFDDLVENAKISINGSTYKIADLFLSSAGYYFMGLLQQQTLNGARFITSNRRFDYDDDADDDVLDGLIVDSGMTTFNLNMFNNLYYLARSTSENSAAAIKLNTLDNAGTSSFVGYLTIAGEKHYIMQEFINVDNVRTSKLYYIDQNGLKNYVTLKAFENVNELNVNVTASYIEVISGGKNYIVSFDSEGNAYYMNAEGKKIELILQVFDENAQSQLSFAFKAINTRSFTLFADWQIRDDLSFEVNNGNNGWAGEGEEWNGDAQSNAGLAGSYNIYEKAGSGSSDDAIHSNKTANKDIPQEEEEDTRAQFDKGVLLDGITYFNNIDFDLIPYYNGRFISQIQFEYFAVEYNDVSGIYEKVKYTLTLNFEWDNQNMVIKFNADESKAVKLTKSNQTAFSIDSDDGGDSYFDAYVEDQTIGSDGRISLLTREKELNKLAFYIAQYGEYGGRRDINKLRFLLKNISSEITVTCKYSIQTFELKVSYMLDDQNSLQERVGNDAGYIYDTRYNSEGDFELTLINQFNGEQGYNLISSNDSSGKMMTISTNCADAEISTVNVPYGYFIYGCSINEEDYPYFSPSRPTDYKENVNQPFNGYEFIYANDWYTVRKPDQSETYSVQNSPMLGDMNMYPEYSIQYVLSAYTMLGFFEKDTDGANNKIIMKKYNVEHGESVYIHRNIHLFAYYYANNTPTHVQFYTWDDQKDMYASINSSSNFELNSDEKSYPFITRDNALVPDANRDDYVDENGYARIRAHIEYGVDRRQFLLDAFDQNEISINDSAILNQVLKTYWYYQKYYDVLKFTYNGETKYVKFNGTNFYFDNGGVRTALVIRSTNLEEYFAEFNGQSIKCTIESIFIYEFEGSNMYAHERGSDRYYQIQRLTDDETLRYYGDLSRVPEFVANSRPRYFMDIGGNRYYMMPRVKSNRNNSASTIYNENGEVATALLSYEIQNIDNFFVLYNDEYVKINYTQFRDLGNSVYISPYTHSNSVTLYMNGEFKTLYLDLEREKLFTDSGLKNAVGIEVELYCPVNKNYNVNYSINVSSGKYEMSGIKINAIPSPNSGFWYRGARQGFVSYIKLTDGDVSRLKQETDLDADGSKVQERIFVVFGKFIDQYKNDEALKADSMFNGFSNNDFNKLEGIIRERVTNFTIIDLLRTLMTAYKYNYDALGQLKSIVVNIPVSFNSININLDNGTETTINLTISVKYEFDIIQASSTLVDDSIYAIPIYSPFIMEFTNDAVTTSGTDLVIDTSKVLTSHFEISGSTGGIGNGIHTYEKDNLYFATLTEAQYEELISSTPTDSKLSSMLLDPSKYVGKTDGTTPGEVQRISFASKSGVYYIVMFYYSYLETSKGGELRTVVRVSDNVVKVIATGSSVNAEIVRRTSA